MHKQIKLPRNRSSNTWDMGVAETSSLNHLKPDIQSLKSGKSAYSENTKRFRGTLSRKNKALKIIVVKRHAEIGFGFSIRGGMEHGTGIFVSNINKYSDAHGQGLQIGDQIMRVNKYSFERMTHDVAVQFIQRHKALRLVVLSLGIVPGSKIEKTHYQWMDCYGRPCSPLQIPQENGIDDRNGMPGNDDERKVNIVVGSNARLGLLIRGGCEYGLGIFVAGVDEESVADRSGIMVGEQILDVNSINFQNISHTDAAHIIRTSKMMTMILKDVGKIPLARVVMDTTEWIDGRSIRPRSLNSTSENKHESDLYKKDSKIRFGIAGSQLNYQSITSPTSYHWIEGKAQSCLTTDEWTALKYHIRQYVQEQITVRELVLSLLDMLDTKDKSSLIPEVRGIVRPSDIDAYDEMMFRIEMLQIKAENEQEKRLQHPSFDSLSEESVTVVHHDESDKYTEENEHDREDGMIYYDAEDHYNQHHKENLQRKCKSAQSKQVYNDEYIEKNGSYEEVFGDDHHDNDELYQEDEGKKRMFTYETLHEETTFNSTLENITDETLLEDSPQKKPFDYQNKTKVTNIMDEEIPGIANEGKHFYGQVNKSRIHKKHPAHRSILKEYNKTPEIDVTNFSNSPPTDVKNSRNVSYIDEQDEEETEQNKLGYAFDFLNEHEEDSDNKTDNSTEQAIEIHSPDNKDKLSIRKASSGSSKSGRSVTSLENSDILLKQSKQNLFSKDFHSVQGSNRRQKANIIDVEYSNDISYSSHYASELEDAPVATDKYLGINQESYANLNQMKYERESSPILSVTKGTATEKNKSETYFSNTYSTTTEKFNEVKEVLKSDEVRKRRSSSNASSRSRSPDFNAEPSYDRRVSNFSINDVMRQNFLPTTRVDYSPAKSSSDHEDFPDPPVLNESVNNVNKQSLSNTNSLSSVNTLTIQNQYQHAKTLTPSMESIPKYFEEPKNYGKPIMTKSPRPEFLPPTNKQSTLHVKVKTITPKNSETKRHYINLPKLRKTKNSDKFFKEPAIETIDDTAKNKNPLLDNFSSHAIAKEIAPDYLGITENIIYDSEVINNKHKLYESSIVPEHQQFQNQPIFDFDLRSSHANNMFNTKYVRNQSLQTVSKSFLPPRSNQTYSSQNENNIGRESPKQSREEDIEESVNEALRRTTNDKIESVESQRHYLGILDSNYDTTPNPRFKENMVSAYDTTNQDTIYTLNQRNRYSGNTDLRAKDSFNSTHSLRHSSTRKPSSSGTLIKSRLDLFNKNDTNQANNEDKKPNEIVWKIRNEATIEDNPFSKTVTLPRTNDEPGFYIDSRGVDKNREIYVSQIQDPHIGRYGLNKGDVIIGINEVMFKKGIQKGLANHMLENAFNNKTMSQVTLHLKKHQ